MRRARHSSSDRDRDRERTSGGGGGEKRRKTEPSRPSTSHGRRDRSRDRGEEGKGRTHNSNHRGNSSHNTSSTRSTDVRNNSHHSDLRRRSSPVQSRSNGARGSAGKFASSPIRRPSSPRRNNVDHHHRRQQSPREYRNHHQSSSHHRSSNSGSSSSNRRSPSRSKERGRDEERRRGRSTASPSRSSLPPSISGTSRSRNSQSFSSVPAKLAVEERHGDRNNKGDVNGESTKEEKRARSSPSRKDGIEEPLRKAGTPSEKVEAADTSKSNNSTGDVGMKGKESPEKKRLSDEGNLRKPKIFQRKAGPSDRPDNNRSISRTGGLARSSDNRSQNHHRRRASPVQNRGRTTINTRTVAGRFVPSPTKRLSPSKPYPDQRSQQTPRPVRNNLQRSNNTFRANNLRTTTIKGRRRDDDRKRVMGAATSKGKLPATVSRLARSKMGISGSSRGKLSSSLPRVPRSKLPPVSGNLRNTSRLPPMPTASPKLTLEELHCDNNNADDYDELTKVEKWVRSAPDELYYERQVDGLALATERTQTLCQKFETTLLVKSKASREEAEHLGAIKMTELIEIENLQLIEQRKMKKLGKAKRKCCHGDNSSKDKNSRKQGDCLPIENSSSSSSPLPDKVELKQITDGKEDPNAVPQHCEVPQQDLLEKSELIHIETKVQHEEVNSITSHDITQAIVVNECPKETPRDVNSSILPSLEPSQNDKITNTPEKDEEMSMEEGELTDSSAEEEQDVLKVAEVEKEVAVPDTRPESTPTVTVPIQTATDDPKTESDPSPAAVAPKAASTACCSKPNEGDSKSASTSCCSKPKQESSSKKEPRKAKQKVLKKKKSQNTKKTSSADSENKEANDGSDGDKSSSSSSSSSSGKEDDSGSSSSSTDSEEGFSMTRSDTANRELERRRKHPRRLHTELWHNDPGLMNDGPVCRCSAKARRFGIRHGFYPGEEKLEPCNHFTNNKSRLYHYRITISPPKNFLISTPTVINHDGHEYIFEGFSIFSHYKLDLTLPPCKVIRFNIRYDVFVEEERFPESFCVKELLLFETYLFREILELVDLKYEFSEETGCSQFHLMPRFVRQLPDNGQEILSMSRVLIHLLKSDKEVVKEEDLSKLYTVEQTEWQNFADRHKGTIITKWGMKPCAIRVDQIDRDVSGREVMEDDGIPFPLIVHFGIRPPQLSYAGNAGYQRAWRRYVKYRHLLSNMPKPSQEDKLKLLKKEMKLQAMRTASNMKRDVTVAISSKGFRTTGICCDLVQHAMLIPVLVAHLRFHKCLETLEKSMVYLFHNRYLLQLAMTHPSYRENFGTNPDHARNALTNCGIRQPEYGDRKIHYASTRKRGINTLINIMAKFGADQETESDITHNERLEFLGDAVVEFVTSIHLFHIFPDLEEGGLATYRAAIVQNQHLAVLAQTLGLDQYMLYAHGSDLCHDSELRHAMANCFEALMGALFLDGGIEAADRVFGNTLFGTDGVLLNLWTNYPKHPLQQEEPEGDREWIKDYDVLKRLADFENSIGVEFRHIRLLARAFTDRSLGYNNLTRGSNQRLEFLGDTVLQLISSEYLYRHFPDHHEGHLSLLRSSLVNNRTQSVVCDDLGMFLYAMRGDPKSEMKTKDRADLLEAFLGALYIDKGLTFCIRFCQVCFFPRLSKSITKQEWNDPKSKLQQCCLTLRAMDGREPDIPVYKVTESLGPTNTRTYIVAVYFRSKRLATAQGHSIQEAEMNAAALALEVSGHLFPQLHHQRRIMDKTKKI